MILSFLIEVLSNGDYLQNIEMQKYFVQIIYHHYFSMYISLLFTINNTLHQYYTCSIRFPTHNIHASIQFTWQPT